MNLIFVDDELSAHANFCHGIKDRTDITSLQCFFTAGEALLYTAQFPVDCAFLDIGLSGDMNGLELGKKLKELQSTIEIAFLTAYDDHAKRSYQLGGRAYLTKPYTDKELGDALDLMARLCQSEPRPKEQSSSFKKKVSFRTFGNFDMLVDGRAVNFKTAKAKEALAFLVDHMGSSASGAQIFFALWEAQTYNSTTSIYVRRTMRALKEDLEAMGLDDILVTGRNSYGLDMTQLYCDSHALLNGSEKEAQLFNGEYMKQYSWGEMTIPLLERAAKNY